MTKEPLLLALDQGTSSSRAAVFNSKGKIIASQSHPLQIEYPSDGWVQQNPIEILTSQLSAMAKLEKVLTAEQCNSIVSCGITNQRETTILWRRSSGNPCGKGIVWQDGRTTEICRKWKEETDGADWEHRTGLLLDPYFSASKIAWLLKHEEDALNANANLDLCFGTVESWLLWNLTEEKNHFSDMSNASRTLLMDIENLKWIEPFCDIVGLSLNALPQLVPCRGDFGRIKSGLPFAGVPIQSLLGDQQAATIGQLCINEGEAKCTYGTGAFLVVNTGTAIQRSKAGLLSTVGWTDEHGLPTYCLEGSLFNAGTVVQWLRDGLGIIKTSAEINNLANEVENSGGVMLVPAFTGWGTPHWDPNARGLLIGLTRDSNKSHIAKAALDGIALSVANLVELAESAIGHPLAELAVDGGAAASDPLLQSQADSTGIQVRRPLNLESTAKGAALFAGLQSGEINDLKDLAINKRNESEIFVSKIDSQQRTKWLHQWNNALQRSLSWHDQASS